MTVDEKALTAAVTRAMENAGTLSAKDSVKLVPADWHRICDLVLNPKPLALRPGSTGEAGEAEFEVWQDDMPVASASGPRQRALAEALHYAAVYGQDGPVEVKEVVRTIVPLPSPPSMLAAAGGEG